MSLATIRIPIDSLYRLPEGAAYIARKEQANTVVTRQGDELFISAQCDSIRQINYYLEEELRNLNQTFFTKQENTEKAGTITLWQQLKCFATGLISGFIILLIIQKLKQNGKKIR